ncbi:hypothetical protein NSU_3292 [Novosphingobium pentaromativorans US6-1]|uniref:Uncharacterized protein n=1 Tax=Novosphingobium pentaromativorans US6-1 TaxID=1088721 RepID=G6EG21_9SPHN|nr:hypothetical protein NSU_3292 [Novosphingobium pentaromativorans US6-1]
MDETWRSIRFCIDGSTPRVTGRNYNSAGGEPMNSFATMAAMPTGVPPG